MNEHAYTMDQEVNRLISWDSELGALTCSLRKPFDIILFGGVVRDIILNKVNEIRDIDIVLCPSYDILNDQDRYLSQTIKETGVEYRRNQFGGYKIKTFHNCLDVWLLKDTWAFREKLMSVSVENLLNSVYLNIDAYAWNYNKKKFISQCNKKRYDEIDIVLEKSKCEALNLIRAVVLSRKYDLPLSQRIVMKLIKIFREWEKLQINQMQLKHYGKVMVKKNDLCRILDLYCMEAVNEQSLL